MSSFSMCSLLHFRVSWDDLSQALRDSEEEESGCGPVLSFGVPSSFCLIASSAVETVSSASPLPDVALGLSLLLVPTCDTSPSSVVQSL